MTARGFVVALSAVAAVVSAVLWLLSAVAKVPYEDRYRPDGTPIGTISDGVLDLILTAKKQARLSACAAVAASMAATLQAISLAIPE